MPEFSKTDLELSMTLDENTITTTPSKGAYTISVTCDKGATGYWDYDAWSVVVGNINEVKVKCAIAFQTGSPKFNEYIMAKSEVANSGVEKIEHEATEQTPALTDYRYVGKSPNNYVCFGYDGTRCPDDNLYRIIGVIPTQSSENGIYENRVKLIKANYYTEEESGYLESYSYAPGGVGYKFDKDNSSNKWSTSPLNTKVLNEVYWNDLKDYQVFIDKSLWYLGAPNINNADSYTSKSYYNLERSNTQGYSKEATSYIGNIGLMYPSDFAYSVGIQYEELPTNSNTSVNLSSWLYSLEGECQEWTITPEEVHLNLGMSYNWLIRGAGKIFAGGVNYPNTAFGIRPTFYLKSSVQYTSGDGSIDNPYRIEL